MYRDDGIVTQMLISPLLHKNMSDHFDLRQGSTLSLMPNSTQTLRFKIKVVLF